MISHLSQRDRIALLVGAVAVLLALLFFAVINPYQRALQRLDARITTRQKQLAEVQDLARRYQLLQRVLAQADQRIAQGEQLTLTSFLEDLVKRYATQDNLVGMRPQPASAQGDLRQEAIEVRLEKVRLVQVIQLLNAIDGAPGYLKVQSLRLKTRFDDRSQLDATFTVAAYRRSA